MKQAEQTKVTVKLLMVQAERIETEFGRRGDIARALRDVINEGYRKNAQAKQKAPDEATIPISVELTLKQARTILDKFRPWIGAPSDLDVYMQVKKAKWTKVN